LRDRSKEKAFREAHDEKLPRDIGMLPIKEFERVAYLVASGAPRGSHGAWQTGEMVVVKSSRTVTRGDLLKTSRLA